MLVQIPNVLAATQLKHVLNLLDQSAWADGRNSAGYLSHAVKSNYQLPDSDPIALQLGREILDSLGENALFTSAALPLKVMTPLFNRYTSENAYGRHIDGAIRPVGESWHRIRTDLSATLFLSDVNDYEGGELIVEDAFGARQIKLPAGDMLLYPGTSVHAVAPVTRGTRLAAFFWIQSMVRSNTSRTILFQLDNAIQNIAQEAPNSQSLVELAGVYHNLLRCWADA